MDDLATRFEEHRGPLRALAVRILGSAADADDVVQEAWLRLAAGDADGIENLAAWLRTVVTRVCLDQLRRRRATPTEPAALADLAVAPGPEDDVVVTDAVSRALLPVLDALEPDERVAFVLHDVFAVPFAEIGPMVGRSPATAKKLASRARSRVRGRPAVGSDELVRQRSVVTRFLAAARDGDLAGVLAVLDPGVVRRADAAVLPPGVPAEIRGARDVAASTMLLGERAARAELVLVDGRVGAVVGRDGRLVLVLVFDVRADRLAGYEVIADRDRISGLTFGLTG